MTLYLVRVIRAFRGLEQSDMEVEADTAIEALEKAQTEEEEEGFEWREFDGSFDSYDWSVMDEDKVVLTAETHKG